MLNASLIVSLPSELTALTGTRYARPMRLIACFVSLVLLLHAPVRADSISLTAPDDVIDSGFLKHLLPRFSLKTGVRVNLDANGGMVLGTSGNGTPVFSRGGVTYDLLITEDPQQARFLNWLRSDIGLNTIEQFQPADGDGFTAPKMQKVALAEVSFDGDPVLGEELSLTHCGRCHVIGPQNAMNSIGSTPSFALLRAMSTWDTKFQQFYVLRPHGAFTQIEDITPPFDPARPSPIAPVEMTLEDLDAILAYVAQVKPADLGAPLQFQ
jgi:mono/diheme cytochrome c family protein